MKSNIWLRFKQCYVFKQRVYCQRVYSSSHSECKERPRNPFYDPYYEESVWSHKPRCSQGRKSLVTLAPGVGVGTELMDIVKRVCVVSNAPVTFEEIPMSVNADDNEMDNLIYSIERNGVAIKGDIEPKVIEDHYSNHSDITRNLHLRKSLDLFVNLTEFKSFPGLARKTRLKKDVDIVLVRLNTEGEFAMLEHDTGKGIEHLKVTTKYNSQRLAEFAFKYASEHGRTKVTAIYNKDLLQKSEGLFLDALEEVAADYPDIVVDKQSLRKYISNLTRVQFSGEVLVTGALHGGMVASLLFGLTHGPGLFCSQNLGPRYAVFEPAARNKGYKLANKDIVNPVGVLLCAVNMLRYLGHTEAAGRIHSAVQLTVDHDQVHTPDMLGTNTCSEVVANVERRIQEVMPEGYDKPLPPFICGNVTDSDLN